MKNGRNIQKLKKRGKAILLALLIMALVIPQAVVAANGADTDMSPDTENPDAGITAQAGKATEEKAAPLLTANGNSVACGDLTLTANVEGGSIVSGTDYTYTSNNTLTIMSDKDMTISMTNSGATTTTHRIVILTGAVANKANITLKDVQINVSGTANVCAFDVDKSTLNLTLQGVNVLKSGSGRAGLQIKNSANLVITAASGDGSLEAAGQNAGIGGGNSGVGGNITIEAGNIIATGGSNYGAGIGGGSGGNGKVGNITIKGGVIKAVANSWGAGIGGGNENANCGGITIEGGEIEAIASSWGAGIGAGTNPSTCGKITIKGGKIKATSKENGAGIGSGSDDGVCSGIDIQGGVIEAIGGGGTKGAAGIGAGNDYNSNPCGPITITGGTVIATRGSTGAQDIGNGVGKTSIATSVTIDGGSVWVTNSAIAAAAVPAPKNSVDKAVYANRLSFSPDIGESAPITAGMIDGTACNEMPDATTEVYGINDVKTGAAGTAFAGRVCLWLPSNPGDTAKVRLDSEVDEGGYKYEKAYQRSTSAKDEILNVITDTTGDLEIYGTASDITQGDSDKEDGDYYYKDNTLYINSSKAMVITMADGCVVTHTGKIVIAPPADKASITLRGVKIDLTGGAGAALDVQSGKTLNLTLIGVNELTSGTGAGLQLEADAKLVVTYRSTGIFKANGAASGGEGIGGAAAGKITINGGTIVAARGIGSPANTQDIGGNSVIIDGGSVWAAHDAVSPQPENSEGIAVFANKLALLPKAAEGTVVRNGLIDGKPTAPAPNASADVYGINNLVMLNDPGQDGNPGARVCLWLPGNDGADASVSFPNLEGGTYAETYKRAEENAPIEEVLKLLNYIVGDLIISSDNGRVLVSGTSQGQTATDFFYDKAARILYINSGKFITIGMKDNVATATDKLYITNNITAGANITLNGVKIDVSGTSNACAFDVDKSTLNLTLAGDNVLKSGANRAGLQLKNSANLVITEKSASGRLTAQNKENGAGIGAGGSGTTAAGNITIKAGHITALSSVDRGAASAGIGAGNSIGCGNITIEGGTIIARASTRGSTGGAGIGAGVFTNAACGNITISGGTITAQGAGNGGAGIGAGYSDGSQNAKCGTITISGGTINATGGAGTGGAGIGAGGGGGGTSTCDGITIKGGTVIATRGSGDNTKDIGNSDRARTASVTITGGSVWAKNGAINSTAGAPKNATDGETVYANKLTFSPTVVADTPITEGAIDGTPCTDDPAKVSSSNYGIKDVKTITDPSAGTDGKVKVCFWLPANSNGDTASVPAGVFLRASNASVPNARYGFDYTRDTNIQTRTLYSVTVNYELDGGKYNGEDAAPSLNAAFNDKNLLPGGQGYEAKKMTKKGYVCSGWNVTSGGAGENGAGKIGVVTGDKYNTLTGGNVDTVAITLAAQWTEAIVNVSVPTKLIFAAFESNKGDITAPEYHIINNGILETKVSVESIADLGSDGFTLTNALAVGDNQVNLYIKGIGNSASFKTPNLTTSDTNIVLPTIAAKGAPGDTFGFTLAGRYNGSFGTARQSVYGFVFKFEAASP
jgi:hypothetical protein